MSTNLPFRIAARPLHRQCLFQRTTAARPFSTTLAQHRQKRTVDADAARAMLRYQEDPAPSVLEQEAQNNAAEKIDDIGILPKTFIRGWGSAPKIVPENGVSWKEQLGLRWRYEWMYLRTKVSDVWLLLLYKYRTKKGVWLKLRNREARREAEVLYEKFNRAFASKNEKLLQKICLTGIAANTKSRWSSRPDNIRMKWEIVSKPLLFHSRIVSNRYSPLPLKGADNPYTPSTIRQIVVRISSKQRLTIERDDETEQSSKEKKALESLAWSPDAGRRSRKGVAEVEELSSAEQDSNVERKVVEYIVLQKKMVHGVEEKWQIWGFAEKTTLEKMEEDAQNEAETAAWEAAHSPAA